MHERTHVHLMDDKMDFVTHLDKKQRHVRKILIPKIAFSTFQYGRRQLSKPPLQLHKY